MDTIQILRKYLSDTVFVQTDFHAYFPLKEDDTVFMDTFMQKELVWYVVENNKPVLYFNKDSMQLDKYGSSYNRSSTFYIKDKYLDTCLYNDQFVIKIRWDVFSTSKFSGSTVFEKGNLFCFSSHFGWVTGYPYYDDSQIYTLTQIESLNNKGSRINIDFKNLNIWLSK